MIIIGIENTEPDTWQRADRWRLDKQSSLHHSGPPTCTPVPRSIGHAPNRAHPAQGCPERKKANEHLIQSKLQNCVTFH